jgi:gluconolactonase
MDTNASGGAIIAEGLQFPEGPVWISGDVVRLVEIAGGTIADVAVDAAVDDGGRVTRVATTGGGPNGSTLGADGHLWVTQNGGMSRRNRATPGIQRVSPEGAVTMVVTEIAGLTLDGPNDLAFGPDGRLWFTDPRGASDPTVNDKPGRIFALDTVTGEGELIAELGPVFPNGIGFLADGTLIWDESFTRRVVALVDGRQEVLITLPERHFPDGFCLGADGTLYVASTYGHCVSVIVDGTLVDRLMCGDGMPTNCCFGGTDLYVTESRHGTLWRFPLGVEGLPLRTGPA